MNWCIVPGLTSTNWSAGLNPRLGMGPELPSNSLKGRLLGRDCRGRISVAISGVMPGIVMTTRAALRARRSWINIFSRFLEIFRKDEITLTGSRNVL